MSKLSSLLNPAPNPNPNTPESQMQPLASGGHKDHTNEIAGGPAQFQSESRHPTLTSPLEALAAAATTSAPMPSPSNPNGTTPMTLGTHQQTFHQSLPRPSSSHTSPPPSFEFARTSDHPAPAFSPGLEQYHHSTSREAKARRLSEITDDPSTILAPLRGSLPNESRQSPIPLPALRSSSEVYDSDMKESSTQEDHNSSKTQDAGPGPPNNAPVLSQIRQPSPTPTIPPVVTALPETQHEQVKVKAEVTEDISELPHKMRLDGSQPVGSQDATSAEHSHSMEQPSGSKTIASLKDNESSNPSPNTVEDLNHTTLANPKPAPTKKRAAPKKGTASAVKPATKKRKLDTESIDGTPSVKRSATPTSSRASKTPAPKNRKQESATPTRSSSVGQQEDDEDMEDTELFCICRKPDDHTWMIGCDGPCEDWFHGRCVNMNEEDGKIIDKWICMCNASAFSEICSPCSSQQVQTANRKASALQLGKQCVVWKVVAILLRSPAQTRRNTVVKSTEGNIWRDTHSRVIQKRRSGWLPAIIKRGGRAAMLRILEMGRTLWRLMRIRATFTVECSNHPS